MSRNLYILGSDSNARFLASQFACRNDSWLRLSLMFNKDSVLRSYFNSESMITYENRLNRYNPVRVTSKVPAVLEPQVERNDGVRMFTDKTTEGTASRPSEDRHIDNLIVTNRASQRWVRLQRYRDYMTSDTNLVFVNPVLGSMERAMKGLYGENKKQCPQLWQVLSSHVLENGQNFDVKHLTAGDVRISACPRTESFLELVERQEQLFPNDREVPYCIKKMMELPMLNSLYFPYRDAYVTQLERMVVDCCIYPLVALLDGDLPTISSVRTIEQTVSHIIEECLLVLGHLNRVKALRKIDPTIDAVLDKQRLFDIVLQIINTVDTSSRRSKKDKFHEGNAILQAKLLPSVGMTSKLDLRGANGYIVLMGKEQKVDTPVNRTLMDLVTTRQMMRQDERDVPE
ncbi:DEKNAAC100512 [Brettanomyces naardenensis]|uniref:DEKNAAC100512 n=1 Tax=Brettanomyces naardenensis TaxID=13370 RepID=A0A448YFI5_BRENA|nr:DEKNAAC100512 [Brettanomyces naardenensis]